MKTACIALLLTLFISFSSCDTKNSVSKIPQIALIGFEPVSDSMKVNIDTAAVLFSIVDGDADIGNDSVISVIYWMDSRYQSAGFNKTPFPAIDASIEDPKKGLKGTCFFQPFPYPEPRGDSLHTATGDTLSYEFYIKDRAGHESNHITTPTFIIRP